MPWWLQSIDEVNVRYEEELAAEFVALPLVLEG
jgi:hypothetical protein